MNSKYLYLITDIAVFIIPFLASFKKKDPFYKKWKYVGIAFLITVPFFLLWDVAFTQAKIWGFNEKHLIGIYLGSLPLEEILFFICIPYASIYIFFALKDVIEKDHLFPHQELISSGLIVLLVISGMYNIDKLYTGVTFILLAMFIAYQTLKLRPRYMGKFYLTFPVLFLPFFIVTGILTGSFFTEEIINYDAAHILGMRIMNIPLENLFYAFFIIVTNVAIIEYFEERDYYKKK